jgi:hypothetical protein
MQQQHQCSYINEAAYASIQLHQIATSCINAAAASFKMTSLCFKMTSLCINAAAAFFKMTSMQQQLMHQCNCIKSIQLHQ